MQTADKQINDRPVKRSLNLPTEELEALASEAQISLKEQGYTEEVFLNFANKVTTHYKKIIEESSRQHLLDYEDWAQRRDALAAENMQHLCENLQVRRLLNDPEAVLVSMMRGTIAIPSIRSLSKVWGEVINDEEARLLEIAELREKLALKEAELADAKIDKQLPQALQSVLVECRQQANGNHWKPEGEGDLALAAGFYALHASDSEEVKAFSSPTRWPWEIKHWRPGDARSMLVKAGAFILEEISRIDGQPENAIVPDQDDDEDNRAHSEYGKRWAIGAYEKAIAGGLSPESFMTLYKQLARHQGLIIAQKDAEITSMSRAQEFYAEHVKQWYNHFNYAREQRDSVAQALQENTASLKILDSLDALLRRVERHTESNRDQEIAAIIEDYRKVPKPHHTPVTHPACLVDTKALANSMRQQMGLRELALSQFGESRCKNANNQLETLISAALTTQEKAIPIGYIRDTELAKWLNGGESYGSVGMDHRNCWLDEPPYSHLVAVYADPNAGA